MASIMNMPIKTLVQIIDSVADLDFVHIECCAPFLVSSKAGSARDQLTTCLRNLFLISSMRYGKLLIIVRA